MTKPTATLEKTPPVHSLLRQRIETSIKPHIPVLNAARYRLLRYTGNMLDGVGCMIVAMAAGLAHTIGSAHGLDEGWPSWTSAAWWAAYLSAWIMFVAGATQTLTFGIALLLAYFVVSTTAISSNAVIETLMLLTVTAIAARASMVVFMVARDVLGRRL